MRAVVIAFMIGALAGLVGGLWLAGPVRARMVVQPAEGARVLVRTATEARARVVATASAAHARAHVAVSVQAQAEARRTERRRIVRDTAVPVAWQVRAERAGARLRLLPAELRIDDGGAWVAARAWPALDLATATATAAAEEAAAWARAHDTAAAALRACQDHGNAAEAWAIAEARRAAPQAPPDLPWWQRPEPWMGATAVELIVITVMVLAR